ncbi:hypothetical protein [Spiroplasma endosymbiont of Virgichneumon dumeticola]|uniref:hypothetical protein n=1 Tax=Spiroplasma endosymbiont of Virgichneumon dumeticola TaxID=3139323 RepID=UPI0035C89C16
MFPPQVHVGRSPKENLCKDENPAPEKLKTYSFINLVEVTNFFDQENKKSYSIKSSASVK